jgi:hypothetical protein
MRQPGLSSEGLTVTLSASEGSWLGQGSRARFFTSLRFVQNDILICDNLC